MTNKQAIFQIALNVVILVVFVALVAATIMARQAAQLGVLNPPPQARPPQPFFENGLDLGLSDIAKGMAERVADEVAPTVAKAAKVASEAAAEGVKALPDAIEEGVRRMEEAEDFEGQKEEGKRAQGRRPH